MYFSSKMNDPYKEGKWGDVSDGDKKKKKKKKKRERQIEYTERRTI
jgi:hypothetical protein